jgi:hypothetical protein
MAWELEAEADHPLVICDRSVLDNYCYLHHAAGPQSSWEPLLTAWLPTYNVLIKVPLWTTPHWDGVRDTDLAFQRDIDALLDEQLQRRGLEVLRLDVEGRQRWGDVVMARLAAGPASATLFPMTTPGERSLRTGSHECHGRGESPPVPSEPSSFARWRYGSASFARPILESKEP